MLALCLNFYAMFFFLDCSSFFPLPFPFIKFSFAFFAFKESNYIRQETSGDGFKLFLWNVAFVCRHMASQHLIYLARPPLHTHIKAALWVLFVRVLSLFTRFCHCCAVLYRVVTV